LRSSEYRRLGKFALVGAAGAVIDFAVFNLLRVGLDAPLVAANILSVCCAIASNFYWNRRWTFAEASGRAVTLPLTRFVTVSLIGLALNTGLLVLGVRLLPAWLTEPWRANVAKAVAIGLVLIWNYLLNRHWTFRL